MLRLGKLCKQRGTILKYHLFVLKLRLLLKVVSGVDSSAFGRFSQLPVGTSLNSPFATLEIHHR
jgi:hypothetical protein